MTFTVLYLWYNLFLSKCTYKIVLFFLHLKNINWFWEDINAIFPLIKAYQTTLKYLSLCVCVYDLGQSEPGFSWVAVKCRRIYICYWSPNSSFLEYVDFLSRLDACIRGSKSPVVVADDFNAWHMAWGSKSNNRHGEELYDLIVSRGLVLVNEGKKATFKMAGDQSWTWRSSRRN